MTQAATVISDKLNESSAWFRNDNGQPTNTYQMINEGYPGDDSTSYVGWNETGSAPGKRIVWRLTSINTPADGNVTLKVRHYANSSTEVRTYEIRQGYVDESTLGTLLGSTTITHTSFAAWQSDTPTIAITGATDGSQLYLRVWVSTYGGATLSAITAIDLVFPDAQVTHNLSGTPDILATTPMTGSGTMTTKWVLTGAPNLTAPTGSGTITTGQGSHTLTDGAPNLTRPTGTGTIVVTQGQHFLDGSPFLTRVTGAGTLTVDAIKRLSGAPDLLPLFSFSGLAAPIIFRQFTDIRGAADLAGEYLSNKEHKFVIYRNFQHVTGGPGGSKYTIFYIVEPLVPHEELDRQGIVIAKQIIALRVALDEQNTVYDYNSDDPGYTFIQPQQDLSPKRPCPAADPVNADGVRTERVSYYSRDLKVVKPT